MDVARSRAVAAKDVILDDSQRMLVTDLFPKALVVGV